jgi:hypothetical protein
MRFGILTHSLPPLEGGIVDHTLLLASAICDQGHEVVMIAEHGLETDGSVILGEAWRTQSTSLVLKRITELSLDHLVLQYTPLMYARASGFMNRWVSQIWNSLSSKMVTSIIVHETYFRTWLHPTSLLSGSFQKIELKKLVAMSNNVFTASQPLIREMEGWSLNSPAMWLPISSNIPLAEGDIQALRTVHGVTPGTLVLTLFGGGNNLKWMKRHIARLELRLQAERIPHIWLLLGGVPREWMPHKAEVLDPGWLTLSELSYYLQMTDIFLMPNWVGVSAKRGTLIAALEHGLPVVGTCGYMSDDLWEKVDGVILIDVRDVCGFCDAIISLGREPQRRQRIGASNRATFANQFSWQRVAEIFLNAVSTVRGSC